MTLSAFAMPSSTPPSGRAELEASESGSLLFIPIRLQGFETTRKTKETTMKRQRPDNDGANANGFGVDEAELTAAQNAANVERDVAAASSGTAGLPLGMAWRLVQDELSSPRASDVTFRIAVAANEGSAK